VPEPKVRCDAALATDRDVVVYCISGAFFFGAAAAVAAALDRIGEHLKDHAIDSSGVPVLDSTAAATIKGFARKIGRKGARLYRGRCAASNPAHAAGARRATTRGALRDDAGRRGRGGAPRSGHAPGAGRGRRRPRRDPGVHRGGAMVPLPGGRRGHPRIAMASGEERR
jgi:hypothetical protein